MDMDSIYPENLKKIGYPYGKGIEKNYLIVTTNGKKTKWKLEDLFTYRYGEHIE